VESSEAARQVFDELCALARTIDRRAFQDERVNLSMGMSGDFELAIAAGSDWVRIGGDLFEGLSGAQRELHSVDPTASDGRFSPGAPRAVDAERPSAASPRTESGPEPRTVAGREPDEVGT
jgi:hypothetical protein